MSDVDEKLALAQALLWRAEYLMRTTGTTHTGVTIVVHDAQLRPGNIEIAVVTTLPTRVHQRVVLGEATVQSAMMDGATLENASEKCAEDLFEFHIGHKGKA